MKLSISIWRAAWKCWVPPMVWGRDIGYPEAIPVPEPAHFTNHNLADMIDVYGLEGPPQLVRLLNH
jgi:hypothetical protein